MADKRTTDGQAADGRATDGRATDGRATDWLTDDLPATGVLRARTEAGRRVTSMELFFDLVYVFAITQLSHLLLGHLTWHGAAQTLLLFSAVWWAWVYTAWFTNWFHPDQRIVRMVLVAVMLVSLLMSATLPDAFGDRGLAFAGAYVTLQVGRTTFAAFAVHDRLRMRRNLQRVAAWAAMAGVPWIAGGIVHGTAREALWVAAVAVDYVAPALRFPTPFLGRSTIEDWDIDGGHLAERCQLFVIVAFGESILVTGASFGQLPFTVTTVTALIVAFLGSVALWWVYFHRAAEAASRAILASAAPGRLARSAYTFIHIPIVAGIIVTAVADELLIAHPTGDTSGSAAAVILGGPGLFLAGHALFKRAVFGRQSMPRLAGIVALAVLALAVPVLSPLALAAPATVVVVAVAVWDDLTLRGRTRFRLHAGRV